MEPYVSGQLCRTDGIIFSWLHSYVRPIFWFSSTAPHWMENNPIFYTCKNPVILYACVYQHPAFVLFADSYWNVGHTSISSCTTSCHKKDSEELEVICISIALICKLVFLATKELKRIYSFELLHKFKMVSKNLSTNTKNLRNSR